MARDVMAGLLTGIAGQMPSITRAIQERRERERMPRLAKLQALANPRDLADIEALAKLLPELTAADREIAIEKVRKRIGVESHPLLDYYIEQAGGAPPLTAGTWRIRGAPAPEAARQRLEQLRMGTQPGFLGELRLGELPEEARLGEWARRAGRAEPRYKGITEVGRGMIPTGIEEVLAPPEAARQRAREAGEWPGVTAITEAWKPGMMFPWEKKETIEAALGKGTMTERQASAARTFIDYTDIPVYAEVLTDEQLPVFGFSRDKQGRLQNDLADVIKEPGKNLSQKAMREIFKLKPEALPRWDEYNESEQARMRLAAFGIGMLSKEDQNKVETAKSNFSQDFIRIIKHPLKDYAGTDQYLDAIISLILFFDAGQIATILTLINQPLIAGGRDRLISLDAAQRK